MVKLLVQCQREFNVSVMQEKSITFLTRYYPPSLNINGESICDMVEYLETNYPNVKCNIIHIDNQKTTTGGKQRVPKGNLIKVKNYFDYNSSFARGVKMLLDGYLLVKKAKKIKNTTYVITTSPPLLPFWAGWLLGKKRPRGFWALDLFPEAFKAKGVLSEKNIFYKWIIKKTYRIKPNFIIALGPKQAEHLAKDCFKSDKIETLLLPCGFFEDKAPEVKPHWYDDSKIMIGYCGNIHDAHNPDFVTHMINHIDPLKHKLVLALYGDKSPSVIDYAKGKEGVYLTTSIPRNELTFIDVHMVSLLPAFTHYAVPSKAVSAVTMGNTVLFSGSKESDSWELFKETGWYIQDGENMEKEVADFCHSITKEEILVKKSKTLLISNKLRSMVTDTYDYIGELGS